MSNNPLIEESYGFDCLIPPGALTGEHTILQIPTIESLFPGLERDYWVGAVTKLECLQVNYRFSDSTLARAPIPDVKPTDSDAQAQAKIQVIRDQYPSAKLHLSMDVGNGLRQRGSVTMQNFGQESFTPVAMPYVSSTDVMLWGKRNKLTCRVTGLQQLASSDSILIHGYYMLSLTAIPKITGVAQLEFNGPLNP